MPSAVRTLLVSAVLTVGSVGVGVAVVDPAPRSPDHSAAAAAGAASAAEDAPVTSPPLSELETRGLAVVRAPFCSGVPDEAVRTALGATPRAADAWENGETARLTPATRDVAHEHGCRWSRARTAVSAWVFAPPVTRARAKQLGRSAARGPGCEPVAAAPAFGSPDTALLCRHGDDRGRTEVSYRGLFGDAWLVCSMEGRAGEPGALLARADEWCGAVVTAATGATAPR